MNSHRIGEILRLREISRLGKDSDLLKVPAVKISYLWILKIGIGSVDQDRATFEERRTSQTKNIDSTYPYIFI